MELTEKERQTLSELAKDLREAFGATQVSLYGSAARGDLDAESDLDVVVVVPHLTWPIEQAICDRCYEATLACGRLVAPCVFSADELQNTPLRASPLVQAVQREGVAL